MNTARAQILITAIDETRGPFAAVKRGLGELGQATQSLRGLLGSLGIAVSAAGFAAMVKSSLDAADALYKLAQRVGITVEKLSTLMPVAQLSGLTSEKFETGLRKLATAMFEAGTGSEEAIRRFTALGVAFANQDGSLRATDQVLLDLADRFKALPDGAEKSALAVALFGKSGAELIPFLNQGRAGIEALSKEMAALGLEISTNTAAQAELFNDALAKLKMTGDTVGKRIMEAFLPALNDLANGMVDSAKQGGTLHAILEGLVLVLKTLALGAATVGKSFIALGEAIGAGMAAAIAALSGNTDGADEIIAQLKGNLLKRFDELAQFRDSLFEPKTVATQPPKIQTEPSLMGRMRNKHAGDNAALEKARIEAEFRLFKDDLERQARTLDAALEDRLLSIRDYGARKLALEQQEIDGDIARSRRLLAEQQRLAQGGDEAVRLKARAEMVKLEAELTVLERRRADSAVAQARKTAAAERELRDALAEVRLELGEITGTADDGERRQAVVRSYRDLRARLLAENDGPGVALVDRLIDVKAAQKNLQALENEWRLVSARLATARETIELQQQAGALSSNEAQRQRVALQQQAAAEMDQLLPRLQAAAAAIGPEAVVRVQAWQNELARTRQVVDDIAVALDQALAGGFATFLEAVGSGAKTAKEAFLDFARSVLAAINRIASQKLAEALFGNLFGGGNNGGSASGIGAWIAGLFRGFAGGGYVQGPGTGSSDSIPARLSAGEYVIRAAAVQRFGVACLDALNGLTSGPRLAHGRLAFAEGGFVPDPSSVPAANSGAVRIVNVIDPALAADYLNSAAGERTILNLIARNAGSVKQVLT